MTSSWTYRPTQDKLLVFVSSRLQECREERTAVSAAIKSLLQQPVLFEHLGARPYPPRDLYLSRLRDSQIMVGVYRDGYGYVDAANGMKVSGLEDEFRFAQGSGIPCLFYVSRSSSEREPRLQALLDEITAGPNTISFYDRADELRTRVASDLAALLAERFLSATAQQGVVRETASDVLARAHRRSGVIVARSTLLAALIESSRGSPVVCVHGPPGIGKTVLAAQFAQAEAATFVRATGLSPKDVFAACAIALAPSGVDLAGFPTLEAARRALVEQWARASSAVLVVDEPDYVEELLGAIDEGGGPAPHKRVVFTSRTAITAAAAFAVPGFTPEEVGEIVRNAQSVSIPTAVQVGGNPLQIHRAVAAATLGRGFEGLADLQGAAGELVRYLALAGDTPLSADELLELRGDSSYSIEALYADVASLERFVDDSPRGLRLMHSEVAQGLVSEMRGSPQRLSFYVNRMLRLFERAGDARRAYATALLLGDGSEMRYAAAAARDAARVGDWRLGVKLTEELLGCALDRESRSEAFHQMISMVYPLELMGEANRAQEMLQELRVRAEQLGPWAQALANEAVVSSRARRRLSSEDVAALRSVYESHSRQARRWDQGRIGLELSAVYIAARRYEEARDVLRPTLTLFRELGDEYGAGLAERNLASALSSIPGAEAEAEQLVTAIEARSNSESGDTRRQRAWTCNLLTRRFRRAGRYTDAERVATEAIAIAGELGDESLRAINLINLGNVYRDMGQPARAIKTYEEGAAAAQKCARGDVDADASRLIAGVMNDFEHLDGVSNQRILARTYALHAVGLLRGGVALDALGSAFVELSAAEAALGESRNAAEAMFDASTAFRESGDLSSFSSTLVRAVHLVLPEHVELYLSRLPPILGLPPPPADQPLADRFLEMVPRIMERAPRSAAIRLLTLHVHELWSRLPQELRGNLVSLLTKSVESVVRGGAAGSEPWRGLYSAVVLCHLLGSRREPFFLSRLARAVSGGVRDIYSREEADGSLVWTVVLTLRQRVTVSILCMDNTAEANVAAFALAVFAKAFEEELRAEVIGDAETKEELLIQVGHIERVPADLRKRLDEMGMSETLREQHCAVTRPTDFGSPVPTAVFVGPSFFDALSFGEGSAGSLQMLFGFSLIEIAYQLLRGQVELDEIRPKIVSLVRRTL